MMYLIDKTKSALGHIKKIVPNVSLRKCHFKSSTRTEIIGTYVDIYTENEGDYNKVATYLATHGFKYHHTNYFPKDDILDAYKVASFAMREYNHNRTVTTSIAFRIYT